jgi:hypothetical protein
MAEEFDKLTESDKLRSFVDTSGFREQLAESTAKIFDTELKSMQLDESKIDIAEKQKLYASNEIERREKQKANEYQIKFAESSFNAKNVDEVNSAAQKFISENPGSALYVSPAIDNKIKSLSGQSATKGQELQLKREKELEKQQTKADKARLRADSLKSEVDARNILIQDNLSSGAVDQAVLDITADLPESFYSESNKAFSEINNITDPIGKQLAAQEFARKYQPIARGYRIAKVVTSDFFNDNLPYLNALRETKNEFFADKDGKPISLGKLIEHLGGADTEDGASRGSILFDQLISESKDEGEIKKLMDMRKNFDQISDLQKLQAKVIATSKSDSLDSEGNPLTPEMRTVKLRLETAAFARQSEIVAASRDIEMKRELENLGLMQKQANLEKTVVQTDTAKDVNAIKLLGISLTSASDKLRIISKKADKELEERKTVNASTKTALEAAEKEYNDLQVKIQNFKPQNNDDGNLDD